MLELELQLKERPNSIRHGCDAKVSKRLQRKVFLSFTSLVGHVSWSYEHGSFLYAFTMTDDCIMQTAFESHISFIEFSGDRDRTDMILPVGWKEKQSVHLIWSWGCESRQHPFADPSH